MPGSLAENPDDVALKVDLADLSDHWRQQGNLFTGEGGGFHDDAPQVMASSMALALANANLSR